MVRQHGCINSGSGLGPDGHACWGFEQPEEFVDATLEFFTDGLRSNQRLVYLSSEPVAEQRERLAPLGNVGAMVDRGALHLRLESRADQMASAVGMSALCGYQRGALPESVLGDLAAIHPTANAVAEAAPFHLFGESGRLVLGGEIDRFSTPALIRALTIAHTAAETTSLDLEALEFIDHHGFEALAAHTRRLAANGGCSVHNRPPIVDRLCGLLEMEL